MNVTLKLTLDGLIQALRWRQIDALDNAARILTDDGNRDIPVEPRKAKRSRDNGE